MSERDDIIDAEIVHTSAPPRARARAGTGMDPNPIHTQEWLQRLRGGLADANATITDLMQFVPQDRAYQYREAQIRVQVMLAAFDATWY